MGNNRNTTVPIWHMRTTYTFRNQMCKPCVVYCSLTAVPVSVTLMWHIPSHISDLSSQRFTLL